MNIHLQKIIDDIYDCDKGVEKSVVDNIALNGMCIDSDLAGKLVMIAMEYLVEIEKKENEIKQLRQEQFKLYRNCEELRRYYSIPYKVDMQSRKDKGIYPAKKNVTVEMIQALMEIGLSQEAVAKKLGISRSTVCRRLKENRKE